MFETIEAFCAAHEHTIAAMEALSTLAAVIVSLALAFSAYSANKTHLKAYVSLKCIVHPTIPDRPSYLTATITNTGMMPLHIPLSFCAYKIPMRRVFISFLPLDYSATDAVIPQQRYPVEIAAKATHNFHLSSKQLFKQELRRIFEVETPIGRIFFRFMKVIVVSDDGRIFKAEMGNEVRQEIINASRRLPQ